MAKDCPSSSFTIPGCIREMPGSAFVEQVLDLPLGPEREAAIGQQLEYGNVPNFLRRSKLVTVTMGMRTAVFEVLPDVLCVGTDADFVRVPMTATTAQRVADLFGATLITPFLSDQIWEQADVRLSASPIRSSSTSSTGRFRDHNALIEKERRGRSGLIAGHKKDVVLTNTLSLAPFKDKCTAVYGWHNENGIPQQPLSPVPGTKPALSIRYADYSHGVRLLSRECIVNAGETDVRDVMTSATLGVLFNGAQGALMYTRYPTA